MSFLHNIYVDILQMNICLRNESEKQLSARDVPQKFTVQASFKIDVWRSNLQWYVFSHINMLSEKLRSPGKGLTFSEFTRDKGISSTKDLPSINNLQTTIFAPAWQLPGKSELQAPQIPSPSWNHTILLLSQWPGCAHKSDVRIIEVQSPEKCT